jgi:hypothetical protein
MRPVHGLCPGRRRHLTSERLQAPTIRGVATCTLSTKSGYPSGAAFYKSAGVVEEMLPPTHQGDAPEVSV